MGEKAVDRGGIRFARRVGIPVDLGSDEVDLDEAGLKAEIDSLLEDDPTIVDSQLSIGPLPPDTVNTQEETGFDFDAAPAPPPLALNSLDNIESWVATITEELESGISRDRAQVIAKESMQVLGVLLRSEKGDLDRAILVMNFLQNILGLSKSIASNGEASLLAVEIARRYVRSDAVNDEAELLDPYILNARVFRMKIKGFQLGREEIEREDFSKAVAILCDRLELARSTKPMNFRESADCFAFLHEILILLKLVNSYAAEELVKAKEIAKDRGVKLGRVKRPWFEVNERCVNGIKTVFPGVEEGFSWALFVKEFGHNETFRTLFGAILSSPIGEIAAKAYGSYLMLTAP